MSSCISNRARAIRYSTPRASGPWTSTTEASADATLSTVTPATAGFLDRGRLQELLEVRVQRLWPRWGRGTSQDAGRLHHQLLDQRRLPPGPGGVARRPGVGLAEGMEELERQRVADGLGDPGDRHRVAD